MRRGYLAVLAIGCVGCLEPTPAPTRNETSDPRDGSVYRGGAVLTTPPASPGTGVPSPGWTEGCAGRLLVIFDQSGSMNEEWPTSGEPRYRVAADALSAAITPLADHLTVGAILFPTREVEEPTECASVAPLHEQFPFRAGTNFVNDWNAYWSIHTAGGSTPLDIGFLRADEALPLDRATAVVVLTDGEPTCEGEISAVEHAASWLSHGVKTYVVGLPGIDDPGVLEAVAAAGGTATYLPVDDASALSTALSSIAHGTITQACDP